MFGLGTPEILLILALALIIIGPKKLPDLAKTLGKSMREFKGAAQDFKNSINVETSISDIDIPTEEIKENVKQANKDLADKKESNNSDSTDSDDADFDDSVPDSREDPEISDDTAEEKPEKKPLEENLKEDPKDQKEDSAK